jgi:hypothetical protein
MLTLCDLYDTCGPVEQVLRRRFGPRFGQRIRVVPAARKVSARFYDASLILGATNVPGVLQVSALNPGTLLVDDSGPHCFQAEEAYARLSAAQDILFSEGGLLKSPHPIGESRYVLQGTLDRLGPQAAERLSWFIRPNADHITGCVLSSLLSVHSAELKPATGRATESACLRHFESLNALGFDAADPHCLSRRLPEDAMVAFRSRFAASTARH